MELNVIERLLLNGLLPAQGTMLNLKMIRELKEDLSFSDEENKMLEFKEEEGKLHWNPEHVNYTKEIEIKDTMRDLIVKALKAKDEKEELLAEHESLWDKFIGE